MLLTSKPVETFEDACRMVRIYLRRWDIEVFHRVLKTGCRVERIELKQTDAVVRRDPQAGEPTIGESIDIVGKLGGHPGRKGDGPPGPQRIWVGMGRIGDFALAWQTFPEFCRNAAYLGGG